MSVSESRTSCPPFFFGTDRGAVTYADGQGFGTDVQQLSSSIDAMLFYEERNRLVIVTRSLLLTQYVNMGRLEGYCSLRLISVLPLSSPLQSLDLAISSISFVIANRISIILIITLTPCNHTINQLSTINLYRYQVGDDGKVSRVMQVKLSVAGDVAEKGLKNVVWASPGLISLATHEKMVR